MTRSRFTRPRHWFASHRSERNAGSARWGITPTLQRVAAAVVAWGLLCPPAHAATYAWDPAGDKSNSGGPGVWNTTNAFWNDGTVNPDVAWPNGTPSTAVAVFSGTGGTVSLGEATYANGLTFSVDGYVIDNGGTAGNTLTLNGATPTITVTNAGQTATISAAMTATGLTVAGIGKLVLTGSYTGTTTINTGATLQLGTTTTATSGPFSASSITNNGALNYQLGNLNAVALNTNISGTGTVSYLGNGQPTQSEFRVGGNNSYTGATTIDKIRLSAETNNAFGQGSAPVTVLWDGTTGGQIYLRLSTITISKPINLNGNGWNEANGPFGAIRISAANTTSVISGPITLQSNSRIGSSVVPSTGGISGAISGAFQLELGQPSGNTVNGTVPLSGHSTYSGGTLLSSGTLAINYGTATDTTSSAIGKGTLTYNAAAATALSIDNKSGSPVTLGTNNAQAWNKDFTFVGTNALDLGTGAVTLGTAPATRSVTVTASVLTVGGPISGGASGVYNLTKLGAGTLILGGANTYTGTTAASAGTLYVNGTHAGAGAYAVTGTASASTVLGGGGTITLSGTNALTVSGPALATPGVIAPGTSATAGTLTVNGGTGVTFGSNSELRVRLSGATSDKLAVGGNLNLSGATDAITFSGTADGTTSYVVATYGTLSGTFDVVNNLPTGYKLDYGTTPGQIVLVSPVPEPATVGLVAAAGLGLGGWVRRRRSTRRGE